MELKLHVGPVTLSDTTFDGPLRVGSNRELIVTDFRGRWAEAASRGRLFAGFTVLTGTTIVAGNVAPPAAAAATVLSLFNPEGSGVDAEIALGWLHHISGTPGAGMWAWCGARAVGSTAISATQNNGGAAGAEPAGTRVPSPGSALRVFTQTALTAGPLHVAMRPFPSSQFAGAIAATTPGQAVQDPVDGGLVIQPGGVISLCPPAIGTTHIVAAGVMWIENDRPNP